MAVEYMSFSAHADAKGIMQLISQCEPRNVLLVHGEADKMAFLKTKITQEFGESTIYLFLVCFQKKIPGRASFYLLTVFVILSIQSKSKIIKAIILIF